MIITWEDKMPSTHTMMKQVVYQVVIHTTQGLFAHTVNYRTD